MRIMYEYVLLIQKYLEKPRNDLEKRLLKRPNSKIEKIINKYDQSLLEKYCYIEKVLEKELNEDDQ